MAALGLLGMSPFLLDDPVGEYNDRIATIFTLMLTSIAFQSVVSDALPNMSYLSILELYVITMNTLLMANAVEICISKLNGWEEDFFFVYLSLALWGFVHLFFAA